MLVRVTRKMLEDLYKGKVESQNIVIEDDVDDAPGRLLVLALFHGLCQRCDQVLLLALERPPHFFVNALPMELRNKVKPVQMPFPASIGDQLPVLTLISAVQTAIEGSDQTVAVVVDSVDMIYCCYSYAAAPQLVHSLLDYSERGNKVEQVVSLIHADICDEAECRILRGRPQTLIRLRPGSTSRHRFGCVITHGEPFEAVTQYEEDFNISEDFIRVVDVTPVSQTSEIKPAALDSESQADPTANLTFNLSLKPEEKAAKDQMVLPYIQVSSGNKPGQIHYWPDDADDFDDEDPDEDLDF